MSQPSKKDNQVWLAIIGYHEDAKKAKWDRMQQNEENWDCFHLKQDWSHKTKGQSKEFLPKQSQSVEQITSFLQQGLVDQGGFFSIEREPGVVDAEVVLTPNEIKLLLQRQLEKIGFTTFAGDSLKIGQLQSLIITKVGGQFKEAVSYKVEQPTSFFGLNKPKPTLKKQSKRVWSLDLHIVRAENWFPDPSGRGLYEQEMIEMDYHALLALAKANPKDFDLEVIEGLKDNEDSEQERKKSEETGQNVVYGGNRKVIRFIEHWGDICDPQTGELLHENVVCRVTEAGDMISAPKPNPLWDGESPYVVSAIMRVPLSVWHKALMDAPTYLNKALNELFNLNFDGGMMDAFGIKQLREDYLSDPSQVADGVAPGQTLSVTTDLPPGAKVLERVDTGGVGTSAFDMFNVADREYQAASFSPDIRMGNLPQRTVKATEIVASNQSIQGVFAGIVKTLEENWMSEVLRKSWLMTVQHMNDLNSAEVKALLGAERALFLANLSNEELFAKTALGHKYKVFGLSQTLNKIQDFKKITTLLQTMSGSDVLLQEFMRKYSISKTLGEIVKALDINADKILADPQEQAAIQKEKEAAMAMQMQLAQMKAGGGKGKPDMQSQTPQLNSMSDSSDTSPGNPANDMGLTE